MRFTSVIVTGALAILASAQATSTSTAVSAASSEQAVITECLKGCPATDVNCQSKCISVPNPNESQVNQTTACVAACDKGDGSPEDTQKYSDCSQKCISQYFFSAGGTPAATAGSGSGSGSAASGGASAATASASGSGAAASASGTATRASGSAATGTDAAATGSTTPNAAPALIGSASFGVVGIIGALLL
ncbi:hypothetical protein CH63R_00732 [Colletotrichum higginsianum IMI 349063]|uniref:Uncharacterized protein n=3 Tax=Colletotrichum higginsianum TaxID=80884 RepID=A0A1B7YUC3_COLHI|nr:hypothetical protein CH63R_00732 [Colletotrichum higginsianum IMI 349063]OBR15552.1 hypothetical protein CH63R_00732 [Colletotrichum higginsianum IMI 349063]TID04521.1 hypothetical protein CH35J_002658 [Colletotrichum higginsianum]